MAEAMTSQVYVVTLAPHTTPQAVFNKEADAIAYIDDQKATHGSVYDYRVSGYDVFNKWPLQTAEPPVEPPVEPPIEPPIEPPAKPSAKPSHPPTPPPAPAPPKAHVTVSASVSAPVKKK